jgi:hypothetical protein
VIECFRLNIYGITSKQKRRRVFPSREMAALTYHHGVLVVPANLWLSGNQQRQELATCEKFIVKFLQINLHYIQALTAILCKMFGCSIV